MPKRRIFKRGDKYFYEIRHFFGLFQAYESRSYDSLEQIKWVVEYLNRTDKALKGPKIYVR